MQETLSIDVFLSLSKALKVIDVRTPAEFEQGHIPAAINIPLFSNPERAEIGTLYKQQGADVAIQKGLSLVMPRVSDYQQRLMEHVRSEGILVHCWRGGMRSQSVADLIRNAGKKAFTLEGGYKSFRRWVLQAFEEMYPLRILGGYTGSGKSYVLQKLAEQGEAVIDLEALAHHKGSAFGHLGMGIPPTQEQFENELAVQLRENQHAERIWLEDESRMIGKKVIPGTLYENMQQAPVVVLDVSFENRLQHLLKEYGQHPKEELRNSILRIERRMGPEQCKIALQALDNHDMKQVCALALHYYDKAYAHGLQKRTPQQRTTIQVQEMNWDHIAHQVLQEISLSKKP